MLDRTAAFHALVDEVRGTRSPKAHASPLEARPEHDAFVEGANAVYARVAAAERLLEELAPRYTDFAGTAMSDAERDTVEATVMEALDVCNALVRDLGPVRPPKGERDATDGSWDAFHAGVVTVLRDRILSVEDVAQKRRVMRQQYALSARERLVPVVELGADKVRSARAQAEAALQDEVAELLKDLGQEELAQLEVENRNLEEQLRTDLEQTRRMEQDAVEVSQLLALFSERVMEQHHTIDVIYEKAQSTVDTVAQVPEQLQQANERYGFRVSLLLFLVLSALILLWFDYMDS